MCSLQSSLHDQNHKNIIENLDICFQVFRDVVNTHKIKNIYVGMTDIL